MAKEDEALIKNRLELQMRLDRGARARELASAIPLAEKIIQFGQAGGGGLGLSQTGDAEGEG